MFYGLIGEKLGHSLSRPIHDFFGDYTYRLFELKKEEIDGFMNDKDLAGFNITIPYKKEIISRLDHIDPLAQRIGAVNTAVKEKGKWTGYNTDYYGFSRLLFSTGISVENKKVLLLGSGGASAAVKAVLEDGNADFKVVSRTGAINYENVYDYADTEVIINATPVGMFPNEPERLLDLRRFPRLTAAVDLIYNPRKTLFLFDAERLGIKTANGLPMLVFQAAKAHDLFCGNSLSGKKISDCIKLLDDSHKNIVLIGMSGAGKSVIAEELGRITSRPVFDTDKEIEKIAEKSVQEIFKDDGESVFRKYESEVIKNLSKKQGVIIATGGGAVTVPENEYSLKSNGVVFRITRDKDKLDRKGRPLVKDDAAFNKLVAAREPLYKKFADYTIENDGSVSAAVKKITEKL